MIPHVRDHKQETCPPVGGFHPDSKVIVKQTAADSIAAIAWFIESKGLLAIADKFTDDLYDYFIKIADTRKSYPI